MRDDYGGGFNNCRLAVFSTKTYNISQNPKNNLSLGFNGLLDEATRKEKKELMNQQAKEEAERNLPEIATKVDIFETPLFLNDDKGIIVNYPLLKDAQKKEKEDHINNTLDLLSGKRKTQEVTKTAIEMLQRMFGNAPEQPRTNGSNLDSDELERKERARRRKSNLNVFASEFTPSFFAGGNNDNNSKTADSDMMNGDVNGDHESLHSRRRRRSMTYIPPELPQAIDPSSPFSPTPYPNMFHPHPPAPFSIAHIPPPHMQPPPPPQAAAAAFIDPLSTLNLEQIVNRIEDGLQKRIEGLMTQISAESIKAEEINQDSNSDKLLASHMMKDRQKELEKQVNDLTIKNRELQNSIEELKSQESIQLKNNSRELENANHDNNQLRKRNQDLEKKFNDFQSSKNAETESTNKELSALRAENSRLETQLKEIQHKNKNFEEQIAESSKLRPQIKELEKQIGDLEKICKHVNELESQVVEVDHLHKRNKELEKQVAEVKVLRQRSRDFENQKIDLQNAKKQIYELENQKIELQNAKNQIYDLEARYENQKSEIHKLHQKNHDIQQKYISKSKEFDQFNVQVEGLKKDLAVAEGLINDYQSNKVELSQARTEIIGLKSRMRESEEEKNRAIAEKSKDLENQVAEVKILRQRLKDFENLKDELQNAKKQVRENETVSENQKSEINRLHQDNLSNSKELAKLHLQLDEQKKNYQNNAMELSQARAEIIGLKSRMREFEEEKNRAITEKSKDLENQVAEVKVLRQRLRDFEILKDELQNAKKQVRENETLSENQKSEINRLHMKNQDSQQESISKSEEIRQLLVRIEDLNRDLNSAREQIKDNQKNAVELLQARTEINELKSQMRETEEKNRLFIEKLQSQSSKATSFEPLSVSRRNSGDVKLLAGGGSHVYENRVGTPITPYAQPPYHQVPLNGNNAPHHQINSQPQPQPLSLQNSYNPNQNLPPVQPLQQLPQNLYNQNLSSVQPPPQQNSYNQNQNLPSLPSQYPQQSHPVTATSQMPQQAPSHPHLQYAQQSLSTAAAPQILPLTVGAPPISAMQTPQTPQLQTMQLFPQTIQPYAANHQPVPQSATNSQIQLPVAQLPTPTASNTTTANAATEQKPPSNQTTKINIHNNNHSNHS
nr:14789_t:CDS:2 [Entrophospora candida]